MYQSHTKLLFPALIAILFLSACTVSKLEARLEANPQCKDVFNPKTGALMPCPETDKAFYRSVGLEPQKSAVSSTVSAPAMALAPSAATAVVDKSTTPTSTATKPSTSVINTIPAANSSATTVDCKPQIHKKTGGMLPCPAAD